MTQVEKFQRLIRNVEAQYRRRDSGTLTGRNAHGSQDALDHKIEILKRLVRDSDEVCGALDRDAKLAARWNKIERRAVGL